MSTQLTASGSEVPRRSNSGGGFFSLYKSGQGYWTRLGTAIGSAAVILFIAWFVFTELAVFPSLNAPSRRYGVAAAVVAILAGITWWIMNGAKRAQFLIDTDSEMKKVNWGGGMSALIGSTRVVVFFMLLTALTLFTFDTQFHAFFYGLGVWHIPFAAGAGIATGFLLSAVLIIVGIALLRGTDEGVSHTTSGTITLVIGLAALTAWVLFTIHTLKS